MCEKVYAEIWPEVKKLIQISEEEKKNDEMLKDMAENNEVDLDGESGEGKEGKTLKDKNGNPIPLEMMPKEIRERLKKKIQEKWDKMSPEEKAKIMEKVRQAMRQSEKENNENLDPKIEAERGEMEDIKTTFEEKEGIAGEIGAARGSGPAAGSGAGIGHDDYLQREGITQADYDFYQKYFKEVSGQATTLKNNLRRIKMEEKKKRVRRLREEGEIDEDEIPGVPMGEYRVFKDIQRQNKMYFKISFVVDMSGSMHTGNRIEEAMKGLVVLLEAIQDWPEDILFEVVGFSNTECIPIREYSSKKIRLKDKVQIIKDVHTLGIGGTNAAKAAHSAVQRNVKGDKKFRRIVFLLTDGELFGNDAEEIGEEQKKNPSVKIVPLGLGKTAGAVQSIPNGRWLPKDGELPDAIYKIMDLEFRVKANGRHGFTAQRSEWGNKMLASLFADDMSKIVAKKEDSAPRAAGETGPGMKLVADDKTARTAATNDNVLKNTAKYMSDVDTTRVNMIYSGLDTTQEYVVKFDESRISKDQESIIRAYAKLFGENAGLAIKVIGCATSDGLDDSLICVYRQDKKGAVKGKGAIDVKINSGKVDEYFLRIVGMLNLAFAISSLPDNVDAEELISKYGISFAFMVDQYKMLSEHDLLKDIKSGKFKDVHRLILELPVSDRVLDKLPLYNELILETLIKA